MRVQKSDANDLAYFKDMFQSERRLLNGMYREREEVVHDIDALVSEWLKSKNPAIIACGRKLIEVYFGTDPDLEEELERDKSL